ncbi:hypothetical protein ACFYYH_12930 [Streptomyces sp. NPDC002018]|uniref:hypothetical protein n=1 Tax=Streptomyces sp. NPDC002018 TaxID=3364629 RepID=UPI00367C163B
MDETTAGAGAPEPAAGRGTGELSRFADLAGVRLYRGNAFAVTGLPADARGRTVRQHRQRLEARLAVEDTWPGDADSPLVGGHRRDEVRAAFQEFQDPRRRLVDELLWRWGDADLGCACPRSTHQEHDEAVRFHALALEAEAGRGHATTEGRDNLWRGAASAWGALLARPEFREHIACRIRALDDPRLGEHTADDFLAGIPRLLVSPFTEFAADPAFGPRLVQVCAGWAKHGTFSALFSDLFEETVEKTVQQITEGLRSMEGKQDAQQYADAVTILRQQVFPRFDELEAFQAFVPDWRYEEAAHIVAVGTNNLAVALQGLHMGGNPTAEQRRTVIELAEKAYVVAPERDVEDIKRNWDVIYEQFSGFGRISAGVPGRAQAQAHGQAHGQAQGQSSSPRRDCAIGCLILLGLAGLIVEGFLVGPGEALLTGVVVLMVIGAVEGVVNWIRGMR